jgi:branched-chain amino acid transport system ATP-binding protein
LKLILPLAHRVYVMGKGDIVFEGTPEKLNDTPDISKLYLEI